METRDWPERLRSAVYRGDGPTVVALLRRSHTPDDPLQLAGDGVLAALTQHVNGAEDLAADCAKQLRERGWYGDDELADQLEARSGGGAIPMLKPLPVDLDELAEILGGGPMDGEGRIDLQTGEVWHPAEIDYAREMGEEDEEDEDPDRWLWVWPESSRDGYRDMERFIETVADPDRADRLAIAIDGRGAFRRFKDVLARWPEEQERWYAFSNERKRGRARAWLAGAGYCVASRANEIPSP